MLKAHGIDCCREVDRTGVRPPVLLRMRLDGSSLGVQSSHFCFTYECHITAATIEHIATSAPHIYTFA